LVGGKLVAYDVANDGLVKVAQDIGLLEPSEKNKTLDTIRRSLADGMKQPRHGPDASSAVHGGWRRPNGADDQQEGDGAREFARRMWDAARLVTNTLASVYLRSRSIASPPPPSVRFHPETPMPGGSRHPALLAAVTDPVSGEFFALHRIALRKDGSGKAEIEPKKATLGSSRGGAVVFGRLEGVIAEGEGVETVLSAVEVGASAIATLSASLLGRVPLPKAVTGVIILGERGSEPAAEDAARLRHAEG